MPVAATSNHSTQGQSGIAGLLNLVSGQASTGNIADQFKSLLMQLSDEQGGTPSNLTQQQISDLLLKEQAGAATTSSGADLAQLEIKIKVLLNANAATATDSAANPSADLISEIAALMQKFPALQQIFTGNIDTQQLQSISDALAKSSPNNPPDFSGLQLPSDLKSQLNALAEDPKASAAFQDAAQQIAAQPAFAAAIPDALQNFSALMQQNASNNLNANAAANSGLLQSNNSGLQPIAAQATTNNTVNIVQAANDKTNIGKSRPQGLLRSLDQGVQAAQASNTTAGAALKNAGSDNASDNSLETELQNGSAPQTASATTADTAAPSFTLNTQGAPLGLTVEQSNALLQTAKSNFQMTGMSEAYSAQLANNTATATANPAIQLAVQMQRNAQLNNNNFIMQLHPEELGRIQVEMKFDGNKLQTKITADKEETLNSLKQDSSTLTKALQNAGLQTDAGSLEFSLGSSNQQQFASQSQKNNTGDQFGTLLASNPIDETAAAAPDSSQWMALGTGHVDVRL